MEEIREDSLKVQDEAMHRWPERQGDDIVAHFQAVDIQEVGVVCPFCMWSSSYVALRLIDLGVPALVRDVP